MAWKEWPLVAFTLLGQTSVGFYLLFVLPSIFSRKSAAGSAARDPRLAALILVMAGLGLGVFLSFFHLTNPLGAARTLSNLRTSWLSREILFELLFMFFLAALIVLAWRGRMPAWPDKAAAILGGVSGILFVISMAFLYKIPGIPAWNRAATPFSFILSMFLLGALSSLAGLETAMRLEPPTAVQAAPETASWVGPGVKFLIVATLFFIAMNLIGQILAAPHFGIFGWRFAPSLKPPAVPSGIAFAARLALLAGSAVLLGFALKGAARSPSASALAGPLVAAAFLLAAASETLARFEFYGLSGR